MSWVKKSIKPFDLNQKKVLVVLALFFYASSVIRVAWLSDDGMITWRTVNNLVNGFGPVWNIYERVQAYTHPLWMMLLAALNFFTREFRLTTYALSLACSFGMAILFVKHIASGWRAAVVGLVAMAASKAFAEFSTSGLENPLTHLLLAAFCAMALLASSGSTHKVFFVGFISALLAITRQDMLLLILPCAGLIFIQTVLQNPRRLPRILGLLLAGMLPFIAWELFSIVYYGFPFPNTFYAKLSTGISKQEYLNQAAFYFRNSLDWDPLTLSFIGFSSLLALRFKKYPAQMALLFGVLIYLVYVAFIGGDFMSGRFFAAPFLVSVCIVCSAVVFNRSAVWVGAIALLLAGSLVKPLSPLRSDASYTVIPNAGESARYYNGVGDERGVYFQGFKYQDQRWDAGLILDLSTHPNFPAQPDADASGIPSEVRVDGAIGWIGVRAGAKVHIVDVLALSDPLLSHLPIARSSPWRIGHFRRDMPEGYLESVKTGNNLIRDRRIFLLYTDVRLATRGDLFSLDRLKAIYRLNNGTYDFLTK